MKFKDTQRKGTYGTNYAIYCRFISLPKTLGLGFARLGNLLGVD
jgi:hypothetical protein